MLEITIIKVSRLTSTSRWTTLSMRSIYDNNIHYIIKVRITWRLDGHHNYLTQSLDLKESVHVNSNYEYIYIYIKKDQNQNSTFYLTVKEEHVQRKYGRRHTIRSSFHFLGK